LRVAHAKALAAKANADKERDRAIKGEKDAKEQRREAEDARAKAEASERDLALATKDLEEKNERQRATLFNMQLLQAKTALQQDDPLRAAELLEDQEFCPPARRDFAWGFLYNQSRRDRLLLSAPAISWMQASADGKVLATAGSRGVQIWNTVTGKE